MIRFNSACALGLFLLGTSSCAFAAEIRVLMDAQISPGKYVRMEADGEKEFVLLYNDSEYASRLTVKTHDLQPVHVVTAKGMGQSLQLSFSGGHDGIPFSGNVKMDDGVQKPLLGRSLPKITWNHRACFQRKSFLRVETIERGDSRKPYLVASMMGDDGETRAPLTSWIKKETFPVQHVIEAVQNGTKMRLAFTEGEDYGSIDFDGAHVLPLVMLED